MATLLLELARVSTGNRSKGSGLLGWTLTPRLWPLYYLDIWLLPHSTPALHSLGPRFSWPYMEPPTLRNL